MPKSTVLSESIRVAEADKQADEGALAQLRTRADHNYNVACELREIADSLHRRLFGYNLAEQNSTPISDEPMGDLAKAQEMLDDTLDIQQHAVDFLRTIAEKL